MLFLAAEELVANAEGAVSAQGADGTSHASGTWTYGAGGGAGGSLWLEVETLILGEGAVLATGGAGYALVDRPGGDGGVGRVRVSCGTVNGVACTEAALEGLVVPAAEVP